MPINLNEVSDLLSLSEQMVFRSIDTPLLADFGTNHGVPCVEYDSKYISVINDSGKARLKLKIPYALYLLNPIFKSEVDADCARIRQLNDAHMQALNVAITPETPRGFWKINIPQRDPGNTNVAIPLPIRNFGAPDAHGFDSATDAFIFTDISGELGIVAIERADLECSKKEIGPRYAILGGMVSRGGIGGAMVIKQTVMEIMEEGLGAGFVESEFYLAEIDSMLLEEGVRLKIQTILHADTILTRDGLLNYLAAQDAHNKSTYILSLIDLVDERKKILEPSYVKIKDAITNAVQVVRSRDGSALTYINIADHRTTSECSIITTAHTLWIGKKHSLLQDILIARGLQWIGGDDAVAMKCRSIHEFLNNAWGGHGALLVKIAMTLADAEICTEQEEQFRHALLNDVLTYSNSEQFLTKMKHLASNLLNEIEDHLAPSYDPTLLAAPKRGISVSRSSDVLSLLKELIESNSPRVIAVLDALSPLEAHPEISTCNLLLNMIAHCQDLDQAYEIIVSP